MPSIKAKFRNYIAVTRPHQWVKNLFIFLPLFFDRQLLNTEALVAAIITFLSFSLAASSIYCINDIADAEADKKHPTKQTRPVASGALSKRETGVLSGILLMVSISLLYFCGIGSQVLGIIGFYWLMNVAYTFKIKHYAIADVFVIAIGFVLRIFAGSFAGNINLSIWIVLMTFLLALFLALAKRQDDVIIYENSNEKMRANIGRYNSAFLNATMMITAAVTIVAYIMYTIDPHTITNIGSHYVYTTSIFVIAGIFRYLQLTMVDHKTGNPTKVLLKDRFIQICVLGWILVFAFIMYF